MGEVAEEIEISDGSCKAIFYLLYYEWKRNYSRKGINFYWPIVTDVATCLYGYDIKTNAQSPQCMCSEKPISKRLRQVRFNVFPRLQWNSSLVHSFCIDCLVLPSRSKAQLT